MVRAPSTCVLRCFRKSCLLSSRVSQRGRVWGAAEEDPGVSQRPSGPPPAAAPPQPTPGPARPAPADRAPPPGPGLRRGRVQALTSQVGPAPSVTLTGSISGEQKHRRSSTSESDEGNPVSVGGISLIRTRTRTTGKQNHQLSSCFSRMKCILGVVVVTLTLHTVCCCAT